MIVAAAATVLGVVSVMTARASPEWALAGSSVAALAFELTAGAALVVAGLVVCRRGPDVVSGWLLAVAGLLRLVAEWNNPDGAPGAAVFTAGLALTMAAAGPLAHALLVHGRGCLGGVPARLAAIAVYAGTVLLGLAPTVVADPRTEGCPACPGNLLRVASAPRLEAGVERWGLAVLAAALAIATGVVLTRAARASAAQRRLVAPVLLPGAAALALLAADALHSRHRGFLSNDPVDRRLWLLQASALWLVAGGVAWQRLQARRIRAALARVVVELADAGRPGSLREALAIALGDRQLELLHAHGAGWIDSHGRARDASGGAITELRRGGRVVAALVHRRGLLDDPRLVGELERTAGLALENDRLHAELRAQLTRLRASRVEIVAVGDAERRRLERDLHDGAQQALSGLAMSLGLARANAADPSSARRLAIAQAAVRAALTELRALAHRINPAALDDGGIAAALDVLAEWAPQLEVARVPAERLHPAVESAAYFAVASVARAARSRVLVDAHRENGTLLVELRASDAPATLVEVEDRVAALDGRLDVTRAPGGDTWVRVALPCAS
jgi:signal transduction histidine kinase